MMDTFHTILTRRSVRKFIDQPIEDDKLESILQAAMAAPSALNEQPWHFIIIRDRSILEEFPKILSPTTKMCLQAPLSIVTCGDLSLEKTAISGYWVLDVAAATQNILLAARALGLGATWCGIYPVPARIVQVKKLLKLPDHVIPFSFIPMGYTNYTQKAKPERFNRKRIHEDGW